MPANVIFTNLLMILQLSTVYGGSDQLDIIFRVRFLPSTKYPINQCFTILYRSNGLKLNVVDPWGNQKLVMERNKYKIVLLKEDQAAQILRWRYPPPYDFYDPPDDNDQANYIKEFLNPDLQFHAIMNVIDEFVGFCSFGADGRVPGGDYSESALDIGVGMKPEHTGKGLGFFFFNAILDHVLKNINPSRVRLTVADFNERALHLYKKFGFVESDYFINTVQRISYTILLLEVKHA